MNAQIQSFTSQATYGLVVDETTGQATDCGCKDRQYRHRQCKHMREFDAEVQKAARFILVQNKVREMAETSRCYREMQSDSRFA
jgi:hypothetical protein